MAVDRKTSQGVHRGETWKALDRFRSRGLFCAKIERIAGWLAPLAHRRGPQLLARSTWDEENEDWVEQVTVEDGFAVNGH